MIPPEHVYVHLHMLLFLEVALHPNAHYDPLASFSSLY
jgi:hypothetical protein